MRRSWIELPLVLLLLSACSATPPRSGDRPVAADRNFAAGLAALQSGDTETAEHRFAVLLVSEDRAAPALNIALIRLQRGDLDGAMEFAERASQAADSDAAAWTLRGLLMRQRGELMVAEDSYRSALALDPGYAPAHRNLGILYELYLGRPDKALAQYRACIESGGETEELTMWIKMLERQLSR